MPAIAAFNHYQNLRHRLPVSPLCNHQPRHINDIMVVAEHYDTFFFDAFGVLNVGQQAIPNAVAQVAKLRELGKNVMIVSNAASYEKSVVIEKFRRFGFDFSGDEIITSRDTLLAGLDEYPDNMHWGVIASEEGQSDLNALGLNTILQDHPGFHDADGFLFLSSIAWDDNRQKALVDTLQKRPRPILLGNPDLIAPMGDHSSIEPGSYILLLEDHLFDHAKVFGKPYHSIYDIAAKRLAKRGKPLDHARTIMLGDTLHTDILGGNAYGIATGLVTDHGFFRGLDPQPYIDESGIVPDYTLPQL